MAVLDAAAPWQSFSESQQNSKHSLQVTNRKGSRTLLTWGAAQTKKYNLLKFQYGMTSNSHLTMEIYYIEHLLYYIVENCMLLPSPNTFHNKGGTMQSLNRGTQNRYVQTRKEVGQTRKE